MDAPQLSLEAPALKYKATYLAGIRELIEDGYLEGKLNLGEISENFEAYLQSIRDFESGINLPEGFSPQSEYWLIGPAQTYAGTLKIRHQLCNPYLEKVAGHIGYYIPASMRDQGYGKSILKLGLEKARLLHLDKVLITCQEGNIASRRVIEANGGIFESSEFCDNNGQMLRFWISLENG